MDAPERRYIFEEMPPRSAAMRQMLPAIASQMIILIYNLTDTFYVGLLNEPAQSAALSVVFPLFTVLNAVANLFGVGGSIVLAQALGRREPDEAKRCSAMTFWNALAASLLLAALFAATASQMLSLCGARVENAQIAYDYARWVVVIGGPFTVMSNVLANLIRGEGNAVAASVGVSLGGVLNIVLDPFFIFPQHLNLGAQGAGIATAVSNMASCVFFLGYALLRKKSGVLSFDPAALREMRGTHGPDPLAGLSLRRAACACRNLGRGTDKIYLPLYHRGGRGAGHCEKARSAAALLQPWQRQRAASAALLQSRGRKSGALREDLPLWLCGQRRLLPDLHDRL